MSKIFDALKKTHDEAASPMLRSLVDELPMPADAVGHRCAAYNDTAAARRETGIRVLPIAIPPSAPILPFDGTHTAASEHYRMARTRIIHHPMQPHMIQVTSPGPGDGKTVTAINLAGALSLKAEAAVLLADGDFRRSVVHSHLGLPAGPGFADVLAGACSLEDAVINVEQFPNLYVLPAGTAKSSPSELLDSSRLNATCAMMRSMFKYIVVDSPPVAAVADTDLLLTACDGVIVVLRPDHTNRQICTKALKAIPNDKLLGVILNCVADWFLTRKGYYGSRYYSNLAAR
jgi:capsular exopolysaccharide synthesis family protein